ncbi:hypothetical protein AMEX_G17859 [Astyanax mexicanus]|uniref:Ig-like domain-containing protein n=1 Tax=Astyanax mexicanus TaxID=7994 RepID=A0A8T2LHJ3_ASTMX|nr:hypothetical protein AMEX_G17859 [Astyanax mexicanus]
MRFIFVILALLLTIHASSGLNIIQKPDIFANQGSSVILHCEQDNADYYRMSWYRQTSDNHTLELLAFSMVQGSQSIEPPFDKADKYIMTRPEVLKGTLQIEKLEAADSALYYCATSLTQ